ncbi:MSHA biogenesis protein MshF [Shewanella livingstonensis]|uniref:MSHA biogenesis protein MshF n=1 Tax=Shewanella livingstonensis TaxID=150120 RepID=A0A3G8LQZ3_9GAMM|nr:MSHA biogenesis protein MshF [Shewanella livingstonensis]AZG71837.1 MSHA biogenesis protein MshF [Shewanella livingstonensis]
MLSQQKADDDLLKVYGRVIAIAVVLVLLAIFGVRYLNTTSNIGGRSLEFEHNRFLNVLAMVRSQWLASGRPHQMQLSWHNMVSNEASSETSDHDTTSTDASMSSEVINGDADADLVGTDNWISLSDQGWPIIATNNVQGCERLWGQLLATNVQELNITVDYQPDDNICRYYSGSKASLSYQLQTGRVIFLINAG